MEIKRKTIEEMRDEWFAALQGKSDEWKAGAMSAIQLVYDVTGRGFGGDACDFGEWLEDEAKKWL